MNSNEPNRVEAIEKAIRAYAEAYQKLDRLQIQESPKNSDKRSDSPGPSECLIPRGDQKTGAIGEFYAVRYARSRWKGAEVVFGNHSQKGWDLKVSESDGTKIYIQVKTASAFGEGKLGNIPKPTRSKTKGDKRELPNYWDQLWVLYLDEKLQPSGFWIFGDGDLDWTKQGKPKKSPRRNSDTLSGKSVPCRLSESSHRWFKRNPECRLSELLAALSSPTDH